MTAGGSFRIGWLILLGWILVAIPFLSPANSTVNETFVQEADLKITCLGDLDYLSDLHVMVLTEETPFSSCQLDRFEPERILYDFVISGVELSSTSNCIEVLTAVSQAMVERLNSNSGTLQEWILQEPGWIHCLSKIRFVLALGILTPVGSSPNLEGFTLGCCTLSRVWSISGSDPPEAAPSGLEFRLEYVPVSTPSVAPEGFIGTLRTGQTTIYNPGDDGSEQRGLAQTLHENGNGTLTDLNSGRTWLTDPSQAGFIQSLPFEAARTACEDLVYGGYDNWRLPTVEELSSIIDVGFPIYVHPIFPSQIKTEMETYWTGTIANWGEDVAWAIDSAGGINTFNLSTPHHVLPVRSDSAPQSLSDRFQVSIDGKTVFDRVTHLEWICFPPDAGLGGGVSFEEAIRTCEELVYAGHDNWRLPNRNEIQSLIDYHSGTRPTFFDVIDAFDGEYWTSTKSLHPARPFPWVLESGWGSINGRDYWVEGPLVLPVRAGLTTLVCSTSGQDPTPTVTPTHPVDDPTPTPTPSIPPDTVHPGGHILVRDEGNHRIDEFDRQGKRIRQFGNFDNPSAYIWAEAWHLLVATDKGIFAFDPVARTPQGLFCAYNIPAGSMKDMVRGANGDLFLANNSNHSIFRVDGQTGAMKGTFIIDPHLSYPDGLELLPNGNLVVSSGGYGRSQLLEFDGNNGQFVRILLTDNRIASPFDIERAEGDTDLYVSSRTHACVVVVDSASGQIKRTLGKGILSHPTGLVLTPDRHLFVADFNTGNIHEFDADSGEHIGILAKVSANGPVFLGYIPGGPLNLPPSKPSIHLEPIQPLTSDDILCHATGSIDPEQQPITYLYQWWIDGTQIDSVTGSVLAKEWTHRNAVIECRVKAYDGAMFSNEATAQVTIQNSPPSLPVIRILPEHPSPKDGLAVWFDSLSIDPDGDELVYLFEWFESADGILWQRRPEISGNLKPFYPGEAALSGLYTQFTQGGEHWRVKVFPIETWTLNARLKTDKKLSDLPASLKEVVILYDLDGNHLVDALDLFLLSQTWYSEKEQVKEDLRNLVFDPSLSGDALITIQRFLDYFNQMKSIE